ncbi:MAG: hypothetical protein ACK5PP_11450 [Acidimicrobiales bacterium]
MPYPKWVYWVLLGFVVFLVLSNPQTAGVQTRQFSNWVGDQLAAVGTFFDGLFSDDADGNLDNGNGDTFETMGPTHLELTTPALS